MQLKPGKVAEIFRVLVKSVNTTLALPQEKVLDFQNKCMQLIESPKTTINQTPTKSLVHYSGSASRENSVQVLAATINPSSERKKSYLAKMKLS